MKKKDIVAKSIENEFNAMKATVLRKFDTKEYLEMAAIDSSLHKLRKRRNQLAKIVDKQHDAIANRLDKQIKNWREFLK